MQPAPPPPGSDAVPALASQPEEEEESLPQLEVDIPGVGTGFVPRQEKGQASDASAPPASSQDCGDLRANGGKAPSSSSTEAANRDVSEKVFTRAIFLAKIMANIAGKFFSSRIEPKTGR